MALYPLFVARHNRFVEISLIECHTPFLLWHNVIPPLPPCSDTMSCPFLALTQCHAPFLLWHNVMPLSCSDTMSCSFLTLTQCHAPFLLWHNVMPLSCSDTMSRPFVLRHNFVPLSSSVYLDDFAQNCSICRALTMEILQSCTKSSIYLALQKSVCVPTMVLLRKRNVTYDAHKWLHLGTRIH